MNFENESMAPQLSDEDIASIKEDLMESSMIIREDVKNDPDYAGEADDIIAIIEKLQSDLSNVKTYRDLSEDRWNHIFANMASLHDMLEEIYADEAYDDEGDLDEDFELSEEHEDDK